MIELINVSKTFNSDNGTVYAVKNVDLSIEKAEIFGVIGYSGAGKSTLVRCINLLERPTSGKVLIDGTDLVSLNEKSLRKHRQKIGMIFQQFNLLASRTVFENVAFPLRYKGISKDEINKKVTSLLELVGILDKAKAYPSQLSGGQKQRVAIARALVREPKILLCDEPTSALDEDTKQDIIALLQKVQQTFKPAVVFVSHELSVVRQLCHRVYVLESGRFTAEFVHQPQPINTSALSYVEQVERSLRHVDQ